MKLQYQINSAENSYNKKLIAAFISAFLFFHCNHTFGKKIFKELSDPVQTTALNVTVTVQQVTCHRASNGSITFSNPSGGSGSYQYSIDGGRYWLYVTSYTTLNAGSYHLLMRDALNTIDSVSIANPLILSEPTKMEADVSFTNATGCSENRNGSILISSPVGGTGSYEYSADGGHVWQTSGNFYGLAAHGYVILIRDVTYPGCRRILTTFNILQPELLKATLTAKSTSTCNFNDGSILITEPSGGSGPYEYSIDSGRSWSASQSFINLAPRTYKIEMRDASNTVCRRTLDASFVVPKAANINTYFSRMNVVGCNGANNGSINFNPPSGGSGIYEYSINGGNTWGSSRNFSNLSVGVYDVRFRDANSPSCLMIIDTAVRLYQPSLLSAIVSSVKDITCYGNSDGQIDIGNVKGGSGSHEFSIDGGLSWRTSKSFTNRSPGTYNVFMRDATSRTCIYKIQENVIITHRQYCPASLVQQMNLAKPATMLPSLFHL